MTKFASMKKIRALIADDHTIIREGLKQLFLPIDDIEVVAEAANGHQVMDALWRGGIDLILLDLSMPGIKGIDLIGRIRSQYPRIPVLVLSMHNEPQVVRRAIQAGAAGYLTKDSHPATLIHALSRVAQGGRFIDPKLAEDMAFETPSPDIRHDTLSNREYEILCAFAKGFAVNEIAAQLAISNKTVSTHKARLMEKLAISSNAELVRYAITHGLVD